MYKHNRTRIVVAIIFIAIVMGLIAYLLLNKRDIQKYVSPPSAFAELELPVQIQEIKLAGENEFQRPMGIALDDVGNFYVTDAGRNRIYHFAKSGKLKGTLGTNNLNYPVAIAVDAKRNKIFIADFNKSRIQVWDNKGQHLKSIPAKIDVDKIGNIQPTALTTDVNGNLYVSDVSRHRIVVFSENGRYISEFGKLQFANGVAINKAGNVIYVADTNNGRVVAFNNKGLFLKTIEIFGGIKLVSPRGIALDNTRNLLYIADTITHQIFIYNTSTGKSGVMGRLGSDAGYFNFPNGLAVNGEGKLYITDRDNKRVVVYDYLEK